MNLFKSDLQLPVETIINEVVPAMIEAAVKEATQATYRELADSFKGAGELDLYSYSSIEEQTTAHAARELGDRIGWLVEDS